MKKQYIDRTALVAKIENIISDEEERLKCFEHRKNVCELARFNTRIDLLNYILSSLNNLEMKEVDLDEEIKRFTMSKELYEADSAIKTVAEHFYELGLNTLHRR